MVQWLVLVCLAGLTRAAATCSEDQLAGVEIQFKDCMDDRKASLLAEEDPSQVLFNYNMN